MVVGWRCHDVAANSHEHELSPPVCLYQLPFVERVVRCWRGLEATGARLGRECQKRTHRGVQPCANQSSAGRTAPAHRAAKSQRGRLESVRIGAPAQASEPRKQAIPAPSPVGRGPCRTGRQTFWQIAALSLHLQWQVAMTLIRAKLRQTGPSQWRTILPNCPAKSSGLNIASSEAVERTRLTTVPSSPLNTRTTSNSTCNTVGNIAMFYIKKLFLKYTRFLVCALNRKHNWCFDGFRIFTKVYD